MSYSSLKADGRLSILCDMSEVFALLAGSSDISAFLHRSVTMVAEHLDANVSSVYLLDGDSEELVLWATVGLNPLSVGAVRMGTDEGLVGLVMRERRPVSFADASMSPYYKYFPETDEEPFGSFAGVPIQRGSERIGVLTVQRPTGVGFADEEMQLLRILTSQLAVAIENARVMLSLKDDKAPVSSRKKKEMKSIVSGRSASSGWAYGEAIVEGGSLIWESDEWRKNLNIGGSSEMSPIDALNRAVAATVAQLEHLNSELEERLPEVASLIFSAHIMMLKDSSFTGKMRELIGEGVNTHDAVVSVARKFIGIFEGSQHDYMREKSDDVKDLAERILKNLGCDVSDNRTAYNGKIVVASELLPSEILKLSVEKVAGVVLYAAGVASHVAILARSLALPMVIADQDDVAELPDGVNILVDANVGNIYVEPTDEVLSQFKVQLDAEKKSAEAGHGMLDRTLTLDNTPVSLMANINLLSELDIALQLKAEGIGLYRTEFPFLVRQSFPTEEEQVRVYKALFSKMGGLPVTFRTLDVGGDKALAYFDRAGEPNPELGLRSIRFSFRYPEIFKDQVRAILLASESAPLRIMFPMIASLEEFVKARSLVHECCEAVGMSERIGGSSLEIGMMIEVPSVVEIIDALAEESDFFSIGTNDFVQYMMAADRVNERVAEYYNPGHPSVLRSIGRIVASIRAKGKDVSVCGEMAHDCRYIPFFIGVGIRALSLDPMFLYNVQTQIQGLTVAETEEYADKLLSCGSCKDVSAIISQT